MILFPLVTIRSVFPLLQAKSQIYAHIYRHTTVQNTTVKSHTHTLQNYSPNVFGVEYICYWSQTRNGRVSPGQEPAKVNCKLLSKY